MSPLRLSFLTLSTFYTICKAMSSGFWLRRINSCELTDRISEHHHQGRRRRSRFRHAVARRRIVASVIHTLVVAGVGADGIDVLRAADDVEDQAEDPCRLVPEPIRERITLLTHDPTDRDRLAYLAAADDGSPILINRAIHEADLVLPIGCLHDPAAAGYYGLNGAVSPTFSDEATLRRFRAPGTLDRQGHVKSRLIEETNHIAWLLGISFSIQLVPDRLLDCRQVYRCKFGRHAQPCAFDSALTRLLTSWNLISKANTRS
ncbi:hypothetical protein LCGC14_2640770 [marine sediment metagenome]|uniref:LarA-like N-terminal domain-containing protein n=1 Tax=marine sediment metagenome TaxID=412755 RepID=A0A0F9C8A1_9ZZZZ